jgi:hypothetical protein
MDGGVALPGPYRDAATALGCGGLGCGRGH